MPAATRGSPTAPWCCCTSRTGRSGTSTGSSRDGCGSIARWRSAAAVRTCCSQRWRSCTPASRQDWPHIAALYGELARLTGSPVVELKQAVAIAETGEAEAALELVDRLELESYHYLHATRAELLRRLDRVDEARAAYARALELVHSEPERHLLERRLAEL